MFHEIRSKALVAIILLLPSARAATAAEPAANVTMPAVYSSPDGAILRSPPIPTVRATALDNAKQIAFHIELIDDRDECLKEFESLQKGDPLMLAESRTLLPALRIFEKHELVRELTSSDLVMATGNKAELNTGKKLNPDESQLQVEISGERFGNSLKVDVMLTADQDGPRRNFSISLLLAPEKSAVVRMAIPKASNNYEPTYSSEYVVITPEIVQ